MKTKNAASSDVFFGFNQDRRALHKYIVSFRGNNFYFTYKSDALKKYKEIRKYENSIKAKKAKKRKK